ncbi:MAG TPA: FAD-dependent oxidoreductase [Acidobacteriaceae bacterium]|nr:FAD-dependent oxidoreductase [Acidobacteriaceae bacterium]
MSRRDLLTGYDVVIVGAGIVGCAAALECARAGLRVGIVERGVVGGATTAAGMGHVVVMDDSPAQMALTVYSRRLWLEMEEALPAATEYESRGTLWVAADAEEMAEVHAKRERYAQAGVGSEVLDAQALAEAEPFLRRDLVGALLVPEDGVVYPPSAAAYFLAEAQRLGAVLHAGLEVSACGEGRVAFSDGSVMRCGMILLASGASIRLLPWLPIHKRKGHLLITDRYPGVVQHQLVELGYLASAHKLTEDSVAFNVQPRQTGQLLIGSSRQYAEEDTRVDAAILRRMLERAIEYIPSLAHLSGIRVWTGFRAATPDKLPLIGPTEDRTLFVAMGFEGLGITNAPGAARLVVDAMLGRAAEIDAAPYLPSRVPREAMHA